MSEPRHISEIIRDKDFYLVELPNGEWGWNGARSALLSESGPRSRQRLISRASKVEGGPHGDLDERSES